MVTIGQLIQQRYRLIKPLGSGGFGAVYLADDQRLNRLVAIKEMSKARLSAQESAIALQLFEREALMLAQLDHPSLTRVWDYFQEDEHVFLVMEYVQGLSLRELLRQHNAPLPEQFVIACAIELCTVLTYLHTQQPPIIFRDLKPANVMVTIPEGMTVNELLSLPAAELHFKLIDFGIARLFKQGQSGDTVVIGTPGYAAPEQYGQGQTSPQSDIYSLGATMFNLLVNQSPNELPLPNIATIAPHVSPQLAYIVGLATQLEPANRYPDTETMRLELQTLLTKPSFPYLSSRTTSSELRPPRPSVPRAPALTPSRPQQSSRTPLLLLIAGVLIALVIGVFALGGLGILFMPTEQSASAPTAQPPQPINGEWFLPNAPGTIAFGQAEEDGYTLYVTKLDGNAPQLLDVGIGAIAPAWSPDGRLAITKIIGERQAILVGEPDAPFEQAITSDDQNARYPAWSPNGRQIAFALRSENRWKLALSNLDTGQTTLVGPEHVAWISWVNGLLLYAAPPSPGMAQDIFTLDVSGTPRNLTNTPDFEEDFPARSPDGNRIAFVGSPSGTANLPQRQIFVMNADGSNRVQLTQGAGPHTNPVWSPDGQWIAYLSKAAGGDWQVWVMRADGSEPRQLTFGPQQKFYLAWGP